MAYSKIACLGDSITHSSGDVVWPAQLAALQGGTGFVSNYAMGGETTSECATRWANYVQGEGYPLVCVLIGINDLRNSTNPWTTLEALLLDILADGSRVVVSSVLPFGNNAQWSAANQTRLESFNASVAAFVAARPSTCTFVDCYAALGEAGTPEDLAAAYDSGDGLHPNAAGVTVIAQTFHAGIP